MPRGTQADHSVVETVGSFRTLDSQTLSQVVRAGIGAPIPAQPPAASSNSNVNQVDRLFMKAEQDNDALQVVDSMNDVNS